MHYNVTFDISQTKFHYGSYLASGGLLIAVSIGMFWFHQRGAKRTGLRRVYLVFTALFFSVLSVSPFLMLFDHYRNYLAIKTALQQSRCEVAEGTVANLRPLYSINGGGAGETFSVGGNEFSYREGSTQNGFHQVGIIRDGLLVRIYYYDWHDHHNKDIARLETAP